MEFGTEVWLAPFGIMESKSQLDRSTFRIYIPNCEKLKSLLKTFTSYNQILTSEEQLCIFSMDSYI